MSANPDEVLYTHIQPWRPFFSPQVLALAELNNHWTALTEEDFDGLLAERDIICLVATNGDDVRGYIIYRVNKSEAQVLELEAQPGATARFTLTELLLKLMKSKTKISMVVHEEALALQLLTQSIGWKAVKVLRNYYEWGEKDGFLMEWVEP